MHNIFLPVSKSYAHRYELLLETVLGMLFTSDERARLHLDAARKDGDALFALLDCLETLLKDVRYNDNTIVDSLVTFDAFLQKKKQLLLERADFFDIERKLKYFIHFSVYNPSASAERVSPAWTSRFKAMFS